MLNSSPRCNPQASIGKTSFSILAKLSTMLMITLYSPKPGSGASLLCLILALANRIYEELEALCYKRFINSNLLESSNERRSPPLLN
jgi:hypothetical protein